MTLTFKQAESDQEWDSLVLSLPTYSFLNSSARFRYEGGSASRYLIFNNNQFLGIINTRIGSSKLFGKFLECKHSPMLKENKEEYWNEVFEFVSGLATESGSFMFRFSPLYEENESLMSLYNSKGMIEAPIHNVDALISQQIDLTKDIEELRRDMNKTKRNLLNRLIGNEDVRVEVFKDESQFELFAKLHEDTVKLKGYTDKPTKFLLEELREQVRDDMCYMLVGYYKEKPIGIWQCTVYGKNMHLYQAATDVEFRDQNINISYMLYWESLKLGKELNCTTLDLFGGVVPKEKEGQKHPWRGVNDFKQSLGGKKVTYMHSRDYAVNKVKYYIYYIYSWFRTSLKGYTIKW